MPTAGTDATDIEQSWAPKLHRVLKSAGVTHMSYVPDAGHASLIDRFAADPDVVSNVLTSEQEGIAIAAGAWLGGKRSVLLLQSSGVGNCINMLSLMTIARFPLLMLVTMLTRISMTVMPPKKMIDWAAWYLMSGSFLPTNRKMMPVIQVTR